MRSLLEYVPGGSIGGCLRRLGKFEENIIKSFTGQIIEGLVYLHANKIIHRVRARSWECNILTHGGAL